MTHRHLHCYVRTYIRGMGIRLLCRVGSLGNVVTWEPAPGENFILCMLNVRIWLLVGGIVCLVHLNVGKTLYCIQNNSNK